MVIQKKFWGGWGGGASLWQFQCTAFGKIIFFALRHSKLPSFALGVVLLASLGPKLAHFC